jgi:hypothetical protein
MNMNVLRRPVLYVCLLLVLAVSCFLIGNGAPRSSAQAQAPAADQAAVPTGNGACTILDLSVFNNRIHVNCQPGVGGIPAAIHYFTLPTGTAAQARLANRTLSLLTVAWAFGEQPRIQWLESSTNLPGGCNAADCRVIDFVTLQ